MSDIKFINTIRTLAADVVAKSNSGHPGAPMGMAPLAFDVWNNNMKFNPKNPSWFNRDRFVLSNGHACALQYILLHLYGFDISMDDLKNFRQLFSKTPGHPERELPGIEVTTGPLGQGVGNAVGIAMAEAHMAAQFNKPGFNLVDNYTYCFLGDGCLQEGVASEAMSLAGHLQLGKLIFFYDDNHISIDGDTNCAFTEDVNKRMEAYGFHVQWVKDGNTDLKGISAAIAEAKKVTDKPSFIRVTTIIGFGSELQGTHSVHGSPLKADDIKHLKKEFGFDPEQTFVIPEEVQDIATKKGEEGAKLEAEWNELVDKYAKEFPEVGAEFKRRVSGELPKGWEAKLPTFKAGDKDVATRKLSEGVLTALEGVLPELMGGSADLTGSNLTRWPDAVDFQPPVTKLGDYAGRYVRYGVREHGMGAIMNGLSAYGGVLPYGGTFLNFVSYASGALRLSALSGHQLIWVATHDSIGLGEDGPTHQPIETLAHFRAIPNLQVWRPADGNETSAAYKVAIETRNSPAVIALSRQNLPQLEGSSIEKAAKGGYVVHEAKGEAQLIIASTGSEVGLSVEAAKLLEKKGFNVRVVSLPDFFTFSKQSQEYQLSVFPDGVPALSVEVMSAFGWAGFCHEHFNLDHFGASAPYDKIYNLLGFTGEGIAERAEAVINAYKGQKVVSRLNHPFKYLKQVGPGPLERHEFE